jgi:hypothetical protein
MKKMFIVTVSGQKIPWLKLLVDIDKNLRHLKIRLVNYSQANKTCVLETEHSKEELNAAFDVVAKRNNATIEIKESQD